MARSINEMTLEEHRALTRYVDAIASRDVCVQLGLEDAEAARLRLRAAFDRRLRLASTAAVPRDEAFKAALLAL